MVDVNLPYAYGNNNSNDYGVGSVTSCEDLSLHDIDYLQNIDENDLLNYNYDELNCFLPDTPPETPVNYNNNGTNTKVNSPDSSTLSNLSFGESLSIDSNFGDCSFMSDISVMNNDRTTSQQTVLISESTIVKNSPVLTTCLPSPLVINQGPRSIQGINLNGLQLNGGLVYSQNDNYNTRTNNLHPKSILPSTVCSTKINEKSNDIIKKQRIEARKVRNREAALNSRMKKKEYVDSLESSVEKLTKENGVLLIENKVLKQKVNDLELELYKLKNIDINGNYDSNKKVKISYFAVLFMFCFQVSPYLISMHPNVKNNTNSINPNFLATYRVNRQNSPKIGRTLLWSSDPDYYKLKDEINSDSYSNSSLYSNLTKSILCKDYYNKTESLRLENQLRDWLTRFKLEEKQTKRKTKSFQLLKSKRNTKKLLFDSKYVPIPRLKLWMQKQKYMDYLTDEFEQASDQYYPFDYENMLAMIHRRDDTFYYLSYPSKGHLILPPISNRTDIRPRFSFLIPSMYNLSLDSLKPNSTSNQNSSMVSPQLFMLQIDCQVINTKVTSINDDSRYGNKEAKLSPKKLQKFTTNQTKT